MEFVAAVMQSARKWSAGKVECSKVECLKYENEVLRENQGKRVVAPLVNVPRPTS
jgi:hypothetical protein